MVYRALYGCTGDIGYRKIQLLGGYFSAIKIRIGSKSKHREMETYETNPDFARVSFLRNTKSAALGVFFSGFEKRNIRVPRAVSPAIRLNISFPSSGMWGVTGETSRRREQRNINICT